MQVIGHHFEEGPNDMI